MLKLMLWVNWRQVDWRGIIKESRICIGEMQLGLCSVSLAGTTKSPFRLRKEPQSNTGVRAGASPVMRLESRVRLRDASTVWAGGCPQG